MKMGLFENFECYCIGTCRDVPAPGTHEKNLKPWHSKKKIYIYIFFENDLDAFNPSQNGIT
jgi:hypothetical protein